MYETTTYKWCISVNLAYLNEFLGIIKNYIDVVIISFFNKFKIWDRIVTGYGRLYRCVIPHKPDNFSTCKANLLSEKIELEEKKTLKNIDLNWNQFVYVPMVSSNLTGDW